MLRVHLPNGIPESAPLIGFAGGGMYISWIMGVAHGMRAGGVPLHRCVFSGASAGAVVAGMLACGVDIAAAREFFLSDRESAQCFGSVTGAATRVRAIVTRLLETMLPADCATRCNGRLHVLLCSRQRGLYFQSEFSDKADVIGAIVASTHVPYFSDGRYAFDHRGEQHVDGAWHSSRTAVLLPRPRASMRVLIDRCGDDANAIDGRPFYDAANREVHIARYERGMRYAAHLQAEGKLPRPLAVSI